MLFRIDPSSTVPLYEQVAASVRRALSERRIAPGDRLPPARELATSLDVNVHTVLRAYATLRDEGVIDLRRRRGAVVTGHADGHARLATLVGELVAESRRVGMDAEELVTIVRRKFS
ncbi:GntR family transcriptional regulator [Saccharomonospora azurea]|uniref:Transcriptional regulator n=1 Tax=Saccharomonospora azurea NA-128 TaxID=882081 RepID=H8GFI5_9PSEU|nr:GntR family transcriptional regulator [Saccharomonospora azurea]EHK87949.1 transcriptional regulator, GntR family protein [Saccharomonospora azurea SZMC 14600]EHY90047.1 putative transcriptional regulator [Saccharomonospora azurea NA-128]